MTVSRPRNVILCGLLLTVGATASPALAKGKPPPPAVTIQGGTVVENFGPLLTVLTRTGNLKKTATVTFTTTVSGLATHPASTSDFEAASYVVTFQKNQAQLGVWVYLTDDQDAESNEEFLVVLSNFSAGNVGSPGGVTIVDDDQPGVITVPDGQRISWNGAIGGCNTIDARMLDSLGGETYLGGTSDCNQSSLEDGWTNDTGGAVTVQFVLDELSCDDGYRYGAPSDSEPLGPDSASDSVDHGAVWLTQTGWRVAINDAGFDCDYTNTNRQPGYDHGEGNLHLDVTVAAVV